MIIETSVIRTSLLWRSRARSCQPYAAGVISLRLPAPAVALTALGALGAVASACSSDSTQVADKVREAAAQELQLSEGQLATTCPDDAEAESGAAFDCQIVLEDQELTAHVEFTSDERFTFDIDGQVFQRSAVEEQVRQQLESEQLLGTTLSELRCGDHELLILRSESTITCRGRDSAGNEGGAVVALDEQGNAVVRSISN
jgi:hypothetical protein